jgi:hypothetical protein
LLTAQGQQLIAKTGFVSIRWPLTYHSISQK